MNKHIDALDDMWSHAKEYKSIGADINAMAIFHKMSGYVACMENCLDKSDPLLERARWILFEVGTTIPFSTNGK